MFLGYNTFTNLKAEYIAQINHMSLIWSSSGFRYHCMRALGTARPENWDILQIGNYSPMALQNQIENVFSLFI